ncbi:methylated-DNA--[protein]-cysteine S-methyltransferase [Methylolobus aquaticus]|nr:methylated-DNA--[protein]-cysteine S-methyltransferase [Methylolobus aquaticus]
MGSPSAFRASSQPAGSLRGVLPVPFGTVFVYAERPDAITGIELSLEPSTEVSDSAEPLIAEALAQLESYFEGGFTAVNAVPVRCIGTPFQQRVWDQLRAITPGTTLSYGQLAARLGSSARAVAGACRANDFPIVIPCHRVVSEHGLGGYCGATDGPWLAVKRWLLRHEAGAISIEAGQHGR